MKTSDLLTKGRDRWGEGGREREEVGEGERGRETGTEGRRGEGGERERERERDRQAFSPSRNIFYSESSVPVISIQLEDCSSYIIDPEPLTN